MKETIVFLHGFLCDERLWESASAPLRDQFETVLIDFRKSTTLEEMVQQIVSVSAETFHLVGFSMGGYVAEVFATRFPARIKTLSLVAVSAGALSEKEKEFRIKMSDLLSKSNFRGIPAKDLGKYVHESAMNTPAGDLIVSMSQGYNSQMYINQMNATLDRSELSAELDALNFPILILAGENDRVSRLEDLKELHLKISRSKMIVLKECGHYIPLEKTTETTEAISYFVK